MKDLNDMKEWEIKSKKRIWVGIYSDNVLWKLHVENDYWRSPEIHKYTHIKLDEIELHYKGEKAFTNTLS